MSGRASAWAAVATLAIGFGACHAATPAAPASLPLPGMQAFDDELQARYRAELAARGPDYRPRTRHLREDGRAKYCNRLLLERSPYLAQHAHNPVNWYPWGEEAFATARRLGRPILLSIGYSTCHWCHVMEEESFEDEEIAAFLNANYVAIKVDREQRPDIDAIYMKAVQMLTGRGGWPMTTWLTPAGEPFFGGTYFPARDGDRGTRTGFLTLLRELKQVYDEQPAQAATRARELTQRIRAAMAPQPRAELDAEPALRRALDIYASLFDPVHGGLKRAPKFPSSFPLRLLLRESARTGEARHRDNAVLTLRRMAGGGIHDQVGGGFHRYSTDASWLVPHFEKMLYDNALLTLAYLEGFQATRDDELGRIAERILSYVAREMTAPDGGFYSATDADSLTPSGHREEGYFFTWTIGEVRRLLGDDAPLVELHYGMTQAGNFEGRNILHVARPLDEVAAALERRPAEAAAALRRARTKMYRARALRSAPLRDEKILTAWNGLMISAFARGAFVLDRPEHLRRAERAADFVLERLHDDGRLLRSYSGGAARFNAYLDDYAFLIAGLIDLYEAGSEPERLGAAIELQRTLDRHYWDDESGGYFLTSDDHERLLAREKPSYDGAEPSGNSVALLNLRRLHALTLDEGYRIRGDRLLQAFGTALTRQPTGLSEMLLALSFELGDPREVVIVTPHRREEAEPFLAALRETYLPNHVRIVAAEGEDLTRHARWMRALRGKTARAGRTTAYVCRAGACRLPTSEVDRFVEQLVTEPGERRAVPIPKK